MSPWSHRRRAWLAADAGVVVVGAGLGRAISQPDRSRPAAAKPAAPMALEPVTPAEPVPLHVAAAFRPAVSAPTRPPAPRLPAPTGDGIVLAQRKRIMGRLASLEHIRRVATEIRPLIDTALADPALEPALQAQAAAAGMSLPEYRAFFAGKQEADIVLESGGDPEARSVSDAIGVCQFLAGTGRARGLRIELGASEALSRKIRALDRSLAFLRDQPPTWSKALTGARPTPGAPPPERTRDEWIALRQAEREVLAAKRRQVDERYVPARVVPIQTRYLVQLTQRYGGVDWALQAYHGGEGGVSRTLALFLRSTEGYTALASRGGAPGLGLVRGLGRFPYETLYFRVSPSRTPAAFSYLFGRSDDHRHYWWKVLMAERALDLYRKDPVEFERQWQELRPGYGIEAAWYPNFAEAAFMDDDALAAAYRSGALVPLTRYGASLGVRTEPLPWVRPDAAGLRKGLRPEAMGALLALAQLYRSQGGVSPLVAACLVRSGADQTTWEQLHPGPPRKPGIPVDPPYETTGYVFQLRAPRRDWDRKLLEYSLDRLANALWISWRKRPVGQGRVYQIVPHPEAREDLVHYVR